MAPEDNPMDDVEPTEEEWEEYERERAKQAVSHASLPMQKEST